LLSSLRIVLAPAILAAAYANSKVGFTVLLAVALITDWLDGAFARAWDAETALGRRLDRWGDGLTMMLAAIGISFLWLDVVERESAWVLVTLMGYAFIGLHRFLQPASARSHPCWMAKGLGLLMPVSLVPLIAGWETLPFHMAAAIHTAVGLQKLVTTERKPTKASGNDTASPLLPEIESEPTSAKTEAESPEPKARTGSAISGR